MPSYGSPGRRVAIVAGVRTPFARSGTTLRNYTSIELGKHCVAELIQQRIIRQVTPIFDTRALGYAPHQGVPRQRERVVRDHNDE